MIPGGSDNPGVAMSTPTTRKQHIRETNRYQTDVTDEEWGVIESHLPAVNSTGRPRTWPMREIINGIFYVMRSGCPWRLVPSDLPPWRHQKGVGSVSKEVEWLEST